MKLIRIATAVLFAGGLIGASASMANAAPLKTTSCMVGYETVETGDASVYDCVPIAVTFDQETTDGTCWTNEDGVNACARGGVLGSTEDPVPASDCVDTTDVDGNVSTMCTDMIADNTLPADNDGTPVDCSTLDVPCDEVMPMVGDESLMYKNAVAMGGSTSNDSNTLAALGVLFGALGAFGIGISNQKTAKK